jgi:hypothetical protein
MAPDARHSHAKTSMPKLVGLAGSVAAGTSEADLARPMGEAVGPSRVEAGPVVHAGEHAGGDDVPWQAARDLTALPSRAPFASRVRIGSRGSRSA